MSLRLLTSCRLFSHQIRRKPTNAVLSLAFYLVSHLFDHIFVRKLLFLIPITVDQPRLRVRRFKGRV